jgi:hypothetical protein
MQPISHELHDAHAPTISRAWVSHLDIISRGQRPFFSPSQMALERANQHVIKGMCSDALPIHEQPSDNPSSSVRKMTGYPPK